MDRFNPTAFHDEMTGSETGRAVACCLLYL